MQTLKHRRSGGVSRRPLAACIGGCLLGCVLPLASQAIQIEYTATDLTDATPGQDLWRYEYVVSGYSFGVGEGFSIYFDFNRYGELGDPPPAVNADWDALATQPSLGTATDGTYDAQALVNAPALSDPFRLSFVWFGVGAPGAQPYELYDASFQTLARGTTVARSTAVAEPASALLLVGGLLTGFARRRRSTGQPR